MRSSAEWGEVMSWLCAAMVPSSLALLRMDSHSALCWSSLWMVSESGRSRVLWAGEEESAGEDVSDTCVGLSDSCSGRERKAIKWWSPVLEQACGPASPWTYSHRCEQPDILWCSSGTDFQLNVVPGGDFSFPGWKQYPWGMLSCAVPSSTGTVTSRTVLTSLGSALTQGSWN